MLKAVVTVTSLTILGTYLLLLSLTYPFVCWTKHRPAEDAHRFRSPRASVINKRSSKPCSDTNQFNLMPMPSTIESSAANRTIQLPSKIRLKSKHPLPFVTFPSSNNATFTLSIEYRTSRTDGVYPSLGMNESYQLNITSHHRGSLFADSWVGVIRGLATFEQLQSEVKIPIPLVIVDRPRFSWRGLMLDVARHFIPVRIVEQTIDGMQRVKMNVLHLHLSDDQGFRLECKTFPRLHDSREFYSHVEMKHLIGYARQRAIRIVPEFDMPAHTASWFVGYPHLASAKKPSYHVENTWGVMNATMDVTRNSTYEFLDRFFQEMVQLFPDPYMHIGGDECEPYEWMQSEQVIAFIDKQRLNDHQGLQAYFTRRVETLLKKYNRSMMGWDEIGQSQLSSTTIIQSWRNKASLIAAAEQGYQSILSNGFYLDHMSSAQFHYTNDLQFDYMINADVQQRILGGEACLWTEYINARMVHSRVWPRTAAIAERLWSSKSDDIECMYDRLAVIDKRFFHPDEKEYVKDLSTLATNVTALRLLADVCEPLGLQGRDRLRNYTRQTLLNRLVDILRPESELTRQLIRTNKVSKLYSTFLSWTRNELFLHSNDSDIGQLSSNLARLGDLGILLLNMYDNNQRRQIISSRWYYYHWDMLETIEYQVPEIRLAGVRLLKDLLQQFDPCSFDLINLSLILFFPFIVIVAQRVSCIRRRLLLPCFNFCYHSYVRCQVR